MKGLLILCPCTASFFVPMKWLHDHQQGIWTCSGMKSKDGEHVFCKRQYSATRIQKELWRGTWNPEEEITE